MVSGKPMICKYLRQMSRVWDRSQRDLWHPIWLVNGKVFGRWHKSITYQKRTENGNVEQVKYRRFGDLIRMTITYNRNYERIHLFTWNICFPWYPVWCWFQATLSYYCFFRSKQSNLYNEKIKWNPLFNINIPTWNMASKLKWISS